MAFANPASIGLATAFVNSASLVQVTDKLATFRSATASMDTVIVMKMQAV